MPGKLWSLKGRRVVGHGRSERPPREAGSRRLKGGRDGAARRRVPVGRRDGPRLVLSSRRGRPTPHGRARRRLVLCARDRDADLREGLRRRWDQRHGLRLPQPRRQRRRQPTASRPVGTDPGLPERAFVSRAVRGRRSGPAGRLGHFLFGRPRIDLGRHRSAREVDRQPDPGRRRLREHATSPRQHGVSAPLGSRARGSPTALRPPWRAALPSARDGKFGDGSLRLAVP